MKNQLPKLLLGSALILSTGVALNAQTLTQDWKYTTDIPAAANARWGTGYDGKVWTNDKSVPQLIYWDKDGKHLVTNAEGQAIGMKGTGISVDAVGNILASDAFAGAGASTTFKILPAGGNALQDLAVTMPEGATAGRMDFIGRMAGNILSPEGGALYLAPQNSTSIAKIFIANGAQVADKSKAMAAIAAGSTDGTVQPLDNDPESNNVVARPNRTQVPFSYDETGNPVAWKAVGGNNTAGFDVVVLNGVTYSIESSQTNYCDGFQIVDRSKDEVVATHTEEFTAAAAKPNANALTAEKVDEYTANIYQYVPGQLVAKYTFSLPQPPVSGVAEQEKAVTKAIGLNGEIRIEGEKATVSVYNMSGQTIESNSTETSFRVPAGFYMVVINGHASKVLVR